MGHWITVIFGTHGAAEGNPDGSCPICDHPFAHLNHACIGSTAPIPVQVANVA
jgi:hypothetical protein